MDRDQLLRQMDTVRFAQECLSFQPDANQERLLRSTGRRVAVNCTRQWGKSTVTALKAVHIGYVYPESLVLVVSPSARQSGEFLRKCARFLKTLQLRVRGDGDNEMSLLLPNGSRIVGLPSTEDRIRGFSSVSLLVIDEASRVEDRIYHAVRPMLAVPGSTEQSGAMWLMSTPNGTRGFFWETWAKGGPEWERIRVPATECPRIPAAFLEEERRANSERYFAQEYMCEFADREDGAFREEWLQQAVSELVPILGQPWPVEQDGMVDEHSRRFFVGLDLGQRKDHTAIAVVERHLFVNHQLDPATLVRPVSYRYQARYLHRLPLGMGYTEMVDLVKNIMAIEEMGERVTLVVDASGVGAPVVEMLRASVNCSVDPVTITGGAAVKMDGYGYRVPRRELISQLSLMLEQGQVSFASGIDAYEKLREELLNMRLEVNEFGQENYDPAVESVHDDLVIAMALAVWKARRSAGHPNGRLRLF